MMALTNLTRRHFCSGTAAFLILLRTAACSPSQLNYTSATKSPRHAPRNIILVHGAWHGGWCWDLVAKDPQLSGNRIFQPTLVGMGTAKGKPDAGTGLQNQIDAILAFIEEENLHDIILVGHSFGGMIVTGLADKLKHRIAHAVYLDAVVPENGQSMATSSLNLSSEERRRRNEVFLKLAPDGVAMPPPSPEVFSIPKDHEYYDWVRKNLTAHPLKACLEPISLANGGSYGLPRTYIRCVTPASQQINVKSAALRIQKDPSWRYIEVGTGHNAMITAPNEVARTIFEIQTETAKI